MACSTYEVSLSSLGSGISAWGFSMPIRTWMSIARSQTRGAETWQRAAFLGTQLDFLWAPLLQVLEVDPKFETLRICASDRKDFYHQMKVSAARASTNVLWPPLRTKDLSGTSAFDDLKKLFEKKPKVAREAEGDFLAKDGNSKPSSLPTSVFACFNSVGQGDHLGVEFATGAHRRLLQSSGLLTRTSELNGNRPFRGHRLLDGLVIDDYFVVSVEEVRSCPWLLQGTQEHWCSTCVLWCCINFGVASQRCFGCRSCEDHWCGDQLFSWDAQIRHGSPR